MFVPAQPSKATPFTRGKKKGIASSIVISWHKKEMSTALAMHQGGKLEICMPRFGWKCFLFEE